MIRTRTISMIFLLAAFSISLQAKGQSLQEVDKMTGAISMPHEHKWNDLAVADDEFKVLFSGLFLFYKELISSQDGSQCSFTPSCSVYGMEAVKHDGVIAGIIKSLDRLTRCNGFSPEKYEIDESTGKLYDPYH